MFGLQTLEWQLQQKTVEVDALREQLQLVGERQTLEVTSLNKALQVGARFKDRQVPSVLAFKRKFQKKMCSHNHDGGKQFLCSSYCVDRCPLSRYCVDRCPLSRYRVDRCPHSNYWVDSFCWFLAVYLINYTDTYGLIYQLLSRQNNLSHIFNFI